MESNSDSEGVQISITPFGMDINYVNRADGDIKNSPS